MNEPRKNKLEAFSKARMKDTYLKRESDKDLARFVVNVIYGEYIGVKVDAGLVPGWGG